MGIVPRRDACCIEKRVSRAARAAVLLAWAVIAAPAAAQQAPAGPPLQLSAPPFIIGYWPGSEGLARSVAERAQRAPALPAIPTEAWTRSEIRIVLAPDDERMRALLPGAPEWGAGFAIPSQSLVILPGYDSERVSTANLPRVLRHELAHIALNRYLEPAQVPRWFDEGYARWAAGEWDFEAAWMLRLAIAMRRAPPLDSIDLSWPARATDARVAYLLSMSAIDFLHDRGGERALAIFLARWKEDGAIEPAMRRTYGLTIAQFEEDWRTQVKRSYGWALVATNAVVFWFFGALLVLWLFFVRRRRDDRKLDRLREDEVPDDPAYWLGEGEGEGEENNEGQHQGRGEGQ